MSNNILVIKLGALGDFIQAAAPFAAIRDYHRWDTITLLTTRPFAEFAARSPWFDEVWIDSRPKIWQLEKLLGLRARLRDGGIRRVYDLQTSDRSSFYAKLFWPSPKPDWSGVAPGCSLPHANPWRDVMHTMDRQAEQLAMAGIDNVSAPDVDWIEAEISRFDLPETFAVLAPGGAAHRPDKRWPLDRYAELARHLAGQGVQPVVIGGVEDQIDMDGVVNLAGQTSLEDLFGLARAAKLAVGNDTGPMHIFAAAGTPSLVLYSHASDPGLCAQRGAKVEILRRESLDGLSVDDVVAALPSS